MTTNVVCSFFHSIVNQMLWSMQLEIPDSPGVVIRRSQSKTKVRGRVFSLTRRESYATRLVEESMEKISEEDDRRAIAAAKVRRNSLDNGTVEETKGTVSPVASPEGLETLQEEGQEEEEETDTTAVSNVS